MQQPEFIPAVSRIPAQATADFCDANPDAEVIQQRFLSYGGVDTCLGPVETIATRDDNSMVKTVLNEAGDGRVLFVDNCGSANCAMLGGDLAQLAASNGWAGIVINGAVRDTAELREAPLAIFALATCPRRSRKQGLGSRGNPARVGGVYIRKNDVIAADGDGVVLLAQWAASRQQG